MHRPSSIHAVISALLGSAALLLAGPAAAAPDYWQDVDENRLSVQSQDRLIVPDQYRTLQIDIDRFKSQLQNAPAESAGAAPVAVTLPAPDGTDLHLLAEDSPIMAPGLAARHPEIRTFRVIGAKDSSISGRIGWTSAGVHGIVFTPAGTIYLDPYSRGDGGFLLSYYRRDYGNNADEQFSCGGALGEKSTHGAGNGSGASRAPGETLRTYRLAMAANYEYTQFHTGPLPALASKTAALNNGIVPTMNRVNGIYERDLAVRMILVDNEEAIIFDNPADPYVNEDGISMLATNPSVLNSLIGESNYDIGHVFSTGGGGVAGLGVVCRTGAGFGHKANGVTGRGQPIADPFDVDYVAHEIGHQFGGNHTFNGSTGSCSGGNRNAATAYEVGSGTTIMAYAGICGAQNTQSNSDDLFHLISLIEMTNYITTGAGNNCAAETSTGNTPPSVDAGADFHIPANTPFRLTATGSDADGDTITYAWEQFDLGPAGSGASDNGSSPIFRAFNATPSPVRVFPKNAEKPFGPFPYGESLPTTNRTLNFRVTARDNHSAGGGYSFDAMTVSVDEDAQFAVVSPQDADFWTPGTTQTIAWINTGTVLPPISTSAVDVLLSLDGGQSYPVVLAENVPNDGSHDVIVPNTASSEAVVQVAAADNVYFAISQGVFTIEAPDSDADGVTDDADNCIDVSNPSQCDSNSDGYGNHCDADLNNNGVINFSDLAMMKSVFFSADADADLDCNGVVNFSDLAKMKAAFFGAPGPSGLVH